MLSRLTIRTRMLLVLTATAVVSVGITAALEYRIARRSIEQQSFQYLIAVREMKANQIEDYLRIIVDQAVTMAESRLIVEAMRDFREAFRSMKEDRLADELGEQDLRLYYQTEFFPRLESTGDAKGNLDDYWPRDETARRLQKIYIHDNPFETGSKHLLDDALDGSTYSQAHRQYHPSIRNFLERFGYYDIFLIDHETGKVVYSVFKEVDFGTSLIDGPYWGTNLAEAFQSARDAGRGKFKIVDFRPYAPSYGGQASFIATPIYDADEVIGVLAFQMPVDRINDIMTSRQEWGRVGLGETGETYIVGDDLTLRNQSRFLIEDRENYLQMIKQLGVAFGTVRQIEETGSSIGLQEVRTEGTLAAVGGAAGSGVFPDYRGVPVFSAYRQLDVPDLNWAIMSEIDRAEALAPVRAMRNRSLALLAILSLVIVGVAIWFSGSLTRPIKRLAGIAAELAEGRLDRPISADGRDEIADLSRSFETMRRSLRTLVEHQEREIEALAVPLIPLRDDVVAMPLMGELDARRLDRIRKTLVEGLHELGATAVLLDLTGVPVLSPESAERLIGAARAVRLLGVKVVLTGMQADVARDLADLDLHMDGIDTARSLENGIRVVLERLRRDEGRHGFAEQEYEA